MGGHGGLNILPQKSWNVYSRTNRARVARDEEQAAHEAANAHLEEVAEQARQNLLTLRARAAGTQDDQGTVAAPSPVSALPPAGPVNFFSEIEAAEKRHDAELAKANEDRRVTSKIMPDLDLGKSARESAPWYVRAAPRLGATEEAQLAAALSGAAASMDAGCGADAGGALACSNSAKRKRNRDGGQEKEEEEESSSSCDADEAEGGRKHRKHHRRRHGKHHHDHKKQKHKHSRGSSSGHNRRHRSSPLPGGSRAGNVESSSSSSSSGNVMDSSMALLRQQRVEREREEQKRQLLTAHSLGGGIMRPPPLPPRSALQHGHRPAAPPAAAAEAAAARQAQEATTGTEQGTNLRERFMALTGQVVTLKPRAPRISQPKR